ncbi:hypothetical protein B0H14DRAFT_3148276 [Mycena olivaceomarginata]|nr:hypothetical protein B0H14DRAFT_3148276 [Mycena olivaceomarginata]
MFPADSRVSAECFTQGGQHTILAYLGFTDGSVMSLTFLDIGFQDPTPHTRILRSPTGQPITHIVSDGSAVLFTSECGIALESAGRFEMVPFKKALRIWKGGIKSRLPAPQPREVFALCPLNGRCHNEQCKIAFGSAEADEGLTEDEDSGAEC